MKGDNCSMRNCSNIAVGYYSGLSYGYNVCEKHAPKELLLLKPNESKTQGQYKFHKY